MSGELERLVRTGVEGTDDDLAAGERLEHLRVDGGLFVDSGFGFGVEEAQLVRYRPMPSAGVSRAERAAAPVLDVGEHRDGVAVGGGARAGPVRRGRGGLLRLPPRRSSHGDGDGGGAVTGALCMAFGVTLRASHGGIFVFFAIGNLAMFLIALVAGTVISALAVVAAKQFFTSGATAEPELVTAGSSIGLHARPAAIIAEAVVNAGVEVTMSVDGGAPVDAGSALMIMTLGAGNGAQVTVASDDESALATVAELVQKDLDA